MGLFWSLVFCILLFYFIFLLNFHVMENDLLALGR